MCPKLLDHHRYRRGQLPVRQFKDRALLDHRLARLRTRRRSKGQTGYAKEIFDNAIHGKKLRFPTVLMDSWYATKDLMKHIHASNKLFYCPLKSNRKVDDSRGVEPYNAVSNLQWTSEQGAYGKMVKVQGFPGDFKLKLFRVAVENSRTEWIVTNDFSQDSTEGTREMCAVRWKIKRFPEPSSGAMSQQPACSRADMLSNTFIAVLFTPL
jgi:hypothetical protein